MKVTITPDENEVPTPHNEWVFRLTQSVHVIEKVATSGPIEIELPSGGPFNLQFKERYNPHLP
jgi:hypothetical protein